MTIKEVAVLAGVSSAAVSRYLNGGPVSEKKKSSIEAAIAETGYHPNIMARTMRTGKGTQIGIITAKIDSESTSEILAGVRERMQDKNYTVMLGVTEGDPQAEIRYIEAMQERQIAGIILMGTSLTAPLRAAIAASGKPIVVTGQNFEGCHCVYHEDYEAVHELMRRMLAGGRRHVGYIGVFEEDRAVGLARTNGAKDAWAEVMGDVPLEMVTADGFDPQDGVRAMERLMEKMREMDGVICATDLLAIGAMWTLRRNGKFIPDDVAIAGVGDSWADATTAPPLTTAHLYYRECGRAAADMLFELMDEEEAGPAAGGDVSRSVPASGNGSMASSAPASGNSVTSPAASKSENGEGASSTAPAAHEGTGASPSAFRIASSTAPAPAQEEGGVVAGGTRMRVSENVKLGFVIRERESM